MAILTPQNFVSKWSKNRLKERASSQSHFNDVCALVGHKTPLEMDPLGEFFTFEADADKPEGDYGWADAWYKGKFLWEYKGPLHDLDKAYRQLLLYKDSLGNPPLLITSDTQDIIIHTNFTNTIKRVEKITFDRLLQKDGLGLLHYVFFEPEKLRPAKTQEQVTNATADEFVKVASTIEDWARAEGRNYTREQIAHFLVRLLFCLFAEDINLLPSNIFTRLVHADLDTDQFEESLSSLFKTMRVGGQFGADPIPNFDGGLFDTDFVPEKMPSDVMYSLRQASEHDWSAIDPSIFGTLFERIIDQSKRSQLGAHYTSKDDILLVVEPVLMAPLRDKWNEVKLEADRLGKLGRSAGAGVILREFCTQIAQTKVLDPACGSGNFLYVALRQMLDLQKEVITFAARYRLPTMPLSAGPQQLYGIEINPYAHELAQVTVWIGYLQWRVENGFGIIEEPILRPLQQIEHRDAVLRTSLPTGETTGIKAADEPVWPHVDVVIGNPPFLGSRKMRPYLGDDYCDALLRVYRKRLSGMPDFVCYWFEKARQQIVDKRAHRAGLLATQAIRGGTNRQVLEQIKNTGDIFMAWSDKEWILDGATVHVSIVGFDNGSEQQKSLDGVPVTKINPDLTSEVDTTVARILDENEGLSFQGVVLRGQFDLPRALAETLLSQTNNPNGRPNSDVIKPRRTGDDIVNRDSDSYVVDFGVDMPLEEASAYLAPFHYLQENVYAFRQTNKQREARDKWWIHWNARTQMRAALEGIPRYIATPRVGKHRIFVWLDKGILPDAQLIVFARSDDYFFGVLQSHVHNIWSRRMGTQLRDAESGARYTSTTSFETFPFPWPPGTEPMQDSKVRAIATAIIQLNDFRNNWLNPPAQEIGVSISKTMLDKITLTNLYNALTIYREQFKGRQRDPRLWVATEHGNIISLENIETLDHIHVSLDHAVLDAYGWPHDLPDEQILERLLKLNLERAST